MSNFHQTWSTGAKFNLNLTKLNFAPLLQQNVFEVWHFLKSKLQKKNLFGTPFSIYCTFLYRVINMGINCRLLDRVCSKRDYFVNIVLCITVKHFSRKTVSPGISKMWSTIFLSSKLKEILGNLSRFRFNTNQQNL